MLDARRQMSANAERAGVAQGEAGCDPASDEAANPRRDMENTGSGLLGAALTRENLQHAWKCVKANKGAAGVDGLDIDQTAHYLATVWPAIREQLLRGKYRPSSVRRVPVGMESLLRTGANAKGLADAGRMAAAPTAGDSAQALEAG